MFKSISFEKLRSQQRNDLKSWNSWRFHILLGAKLLPIIEDPPTLEEPPEEPLHSNFVFSSAEMIKIFEKFVES